MSLDFKDRALVETAKNIIKMRFLHSRHSIGAAVRMRSGEVFLGVNLNTYAGHLAVCAEGVAIGAAAVDLGDESIDTIVAVRHPAWGEHGGEIKVVTPCGACRERIFDFGPEARVIVPGVDSLVAVPIGFLIPNKYQRPL